MSLNTHARCDWCEAVLIADDEDDLVDEGWLVVRFGLRDERQDFCSLPCLSKWGVSVGAAELVHASMTEFEEEDPE